MRGKAGLALGLAIGYVLGTRAGRERYEQIKVQWLKLWELDVVQDQVDKVTDFAKSSAMALPSTLWNSAVKVTKAAATKGSPGQKLDAFIDTSRESAEEVAEAAEETAAAVKDAAESANSSTSTAKPAAKSSAKKPATKRTGA
ncbi:hypothetical protein [Microbacterium sp. C7(2022)]|uniref:hypothetical protein n=1 Tax=Microbacterium sp. C7(2022) TaxID=2992759 RepID=UPI00237B9729|nr:hypothetical protein [Microbacterium sp. C7(2022)]MDE0546540.1 hypothetical protein [Microbacterium sp. C7(2022)]